MSKRNFFILLFLAVIVYAFNLRLDVMLIDAAQYAEISWEMITTKSFLAVHCNGGDYLDKPPLLFWLNSVSMAIFGVNNFSFKLPSVLFALLAVYSTYGFAQIYYDKKTAQIAALMLATSQAVFLITNDVRTDTILMGSVILAIWQLAEFFETSAAKNLLIGSMGLALALLAKGPIGLIATGAAIVPHLLLKGTFKKLFDRRILAGLVVICLLLVPMCVGLYQQFGMKGLTFYFWTQSFGRITGQSEWNNHPDTFFLVHTSAWAFSPWSLFFFTGWLYGLFVLIKNRFSTAGQPEIISLSGFTLVLICLSLSRYQLPHYIFVVYPLAAVIAANCLMQAIAWHKAKRALATIQIVVLLLLVLLSVLLQWAFKGLEPVSLLCLIVLYPLAIGGAIALSGPTGGKPAGTPFAAFILEVTYRKLFYVSLMVAVVFNFLLSAFFFPQILKYQPQNDFGRYIKVHALNSNLVFYKTVGDFAYVFYGRQLPIVNLWNREDLRKILKEKGELIVCTSQSGLDELKADNISYTLVQAREAFGIAQLNGQFLNPSTRHDACQMVYLLQVRQ